MRLRHWMMAGLVLAGLSLPVLAQDALPAAAPPVRLIHVAEGDAAMAGYDPMSTPRNISERESKRTGWLYGWLRRDGKGAPNAKGESPATFDCDGVEAPVYRQRADGVFEAEIKFRYPDLADDAKEPKYSLIVDGGTFRYSYVRQP